jgi:hypothetical protein
MQSIQQDAQCSSWGISSKCLFTALLAALVAGSSATANGQSPGGEIMAAAVSIPMWGGPGPGPCGTNVNYLQPVLRFEFVGRGPLNPLSSIPPCPESLVNDPSYVVFNSQGELFVANRHGIVGGGIGSIARFTLDAAGGFAAHGAIVGNSLEAVHGLAISAKGELFAANLINGTISRFLFDGQGSAVPNGTIVTGVVQNHGLAFAANGELFSSHSIVNVVKRWIFNPITGVAIPNGTFSAPGSWSIAGLTFSATGELFIADPETNRVYRFLFDGNGDPVGNGSISVAGGPYGVVFSSARELFVTSHYSGGISRFLFDSSGNAIPNGFIATPNLGGVAILSRKLTVSIDIKPGSSPNSLNPHSEGKIPVAIITTEAFDAATVDAATVRFGATGTEAAPVQYALKDVDLDGHIDMILHFNSEETGIQSGDSSASLSGTSLTGQAIVGSDSISTVGGNTKLK